jgi:GNAT superfamily N-acetyltransferase
MPFVLRSEWVGRRVSVRRAVDRDDSGQIRFGDIVGDLVHLDSQHAMVETRSGRVEIPITHIAVAREAHPSTADVLALEAICERGWRAAETAEIGGWLLRADHGFTGRANSALPLGRPQSLDQTLELARAWYAGRGLPLKIQLPWPARRLLDSELGERGFEIGEDVHVLAARIDLLALPDLAVSATITAQPDAAWLGEYHYRDQPQLPDGAAQLLARHDRALFLAIRADDQVVAIGRGAVDSGWVGITAVEVRTEYRRRGLGRAVLAGLVAAARDRHGAERAYLQVASTNQPAISLYLNAGFWHHHDYRYCTESPMPSVATDA